MKTRYFVPNLFTGLNFLIGFFSILVMVEAFTEPGARILGSSKEPLVLAAWMIIWCVLFDKLDGFAAKVLKASSEFGAQFDSMADLVAFGVAPGLLVYFFCELTDKDWFGSHRPLMIISTAVYVLCASMRLARYNAIDADELPNYFHGLASTFAGGFVSLSVILFAKHDLAGRVPGALVGLPLILILSGLLMVSPFYLPKLVRRQNQFLNLMQIAGIIIGYICGFGMRAPEFLYACVLTYGVVGFAYGFFKKGLIAQSIEQPARPEG